MKKVYQVQVGSSKENAVEVVYVQSSSAGMAEKKALSAVKEKRTLLGLLFVKSIALLGPLS